MYVCLCVCLFVQIYLQAVHAVLFFFVGNYKLRCITYSEISEKLFTKNLNFFRNFLDFFLKFLLDLFLKFLLDLFRKFNVFQFFKAFVCFRVAEMYFFCFTFDALQITFIDTDKIKNLKIKVHCKQSSKKE